MTDHDDMPDSAAFEQWFRAWNSRLVDYAGAIIRRDRQAAQDAVAEAWALAWQRRGDYVDRDDPLPWLRGFTRFAALHFIRDSWGRPGADGRQRWRLVSVAEIDRWLPDVCDPDPTDPDPDESSYPGLCDPETHRALDEVWPYLRQVEAVAVWLCCIGGYSSAEAAGQMGLPSARAAWRYREFGLAKIRRYFHGSHPAGRGGRAP
jgi:DNA-directed RNA polymerase specialized sigma24 family protein